MKTPLELVHGQIWESRYPGRGRHRVIWVSDCGTKLRAIRVGGPSGRYLDATTLLRDYRLVAAS